MSTRKASKRQKHQRQAMVLVLILWILVVLAMLSVTLVENSKLDNSLSITAGDKVVVRWLARAGVHRAVSILLSDDRTTDSPGDSWYADTQSFRQVTLTGGQFSLVADRYTDRSNAVHGLVDEASKLNINTASREALLALPGVDIIMADALIQHRNQQLGQALTRQAELPQEISKKGAPAFPKAFHTIREFALVAGITHKDLFGEDTNLNGILENNENDGDELPPSDNSNDILDRGLLSYITVYSYELNIDGEGQSRININTASMDTLQSELLLAEAHARWVVENRVPEFAGIADLLSETTALSENTNDLLADEQARPLDVATFQRIADQITVTDVARIPGRININTAISTVLQTLPGVTAELADRIQRHRLAKPGGFRSIAELLFLEGMTIGHFKQMAPLTTVRSNVFTIRSMGQAEHTPLTHWVEAVVERDPQLRLCYWRESR